MPAVIASICRDGPRCGASPHARLRRTSLGPCSVGAVQPPEDTTDQEFFASLNAYARLRARECTCDRESAGVFVTASAWARPAWMHVRIRPRRRRHHPRVIVVVRGCVDRKKAPLP